jgi:hypothetical protein
MRGVPVLKLLRDLSQSTATGAILGIAAWLAFTVTGTAATAGSSNASADSLIRLAAGYYPAEPTVPELLAGFGGNQMRDVSALADESFFVPEGRIEVGIVALHSAQAHGLRLVWHPAGNAEDFNDLTPASAVGDSTAIVLRTGQKIAFGLVGPDGDVRSSESHLNPGGEAHVRFYPTDEPGKYLMLWEDLSGLSDDDFNDVVAWVRFAEGDTRATTKDRDEKQSTLEDAWSLAADASAIQISVNLDNAFTICRPETVCVPFAITGECDAVSVRTEAPVHFNADRTALCYYAPGSTNFCVKLVAEDTCSNYDSVEVCFTIETQDPVTYNCPGVVDTVICDPGIVCFPVTATGGTPPIVIDAVPPAYYDDIAGEICYPVFGPGVYQVTSFAANATCPAETCTTELHVDFNAPPQVTGIPDTIVNVCTTGEYCFGPIACTDADGNLATCVQASGPGSFNVENWCYTPTATETVAVVFLATDECGLEGWDTLRVAFALALPPELLFDDVSVTLCSAETVCVPFSLLNPSGGTVTLELASQGSLDLTDSTVCLSVGAPGDYELVLVANGPCGTSDTARATIGASFNGAPSVTCTTPEDDTVCAGTEVCIWYTADDPDGDDLEVTITGPGFTIPRIAQAGTTDSVCVTVVEPGPQTVTITATDPCGESGVCQADFIMWVNAPPTVSVNDSTVFLCDELPICIPINCADPDGDLETCDAEGSASGFYSASAFCFVADTPGVYTVTGFATDACGSAAEQTAVIDVRFDTPPDVQIIGNDLISTDPGAVVCFDYTATDPDGNLASVVPHGTVQSFTTNEICLTAVEGSVECAWIVATDVCGIQDSARVCVSASSAPPPRPVPQIPDTVETRLCALGDFCIPFTIEPTDCPPQVLSALPGATIDPDIPALCFNLSDTGTYESGVVAMDDCGAETTTVVLIVLPNNAPEIVCPQSEYYWVCGDSNVCMTVAYADPDSNFMDATVSYGTVAPKFKGLFEVCMPVDSTGWYTSELIVRDSCGLADTCHLEVFIQRNVPPRIFAPEDTTIFLCYPDQVCLPVSCFDPDYNFEYCAPTSLGDATWDGATLCFTPLVSGDYQWVFRAEDACGDTDVDTIKVTIQMNRPPSITAPTSVTFQLCEPETVCVPYEISDPDGGSLQVFKEGCDCDGHPGEICVYRETSGTQCVQVVVVDECYLADTIDICVNYELNQPPEVNAPDDFTAVVCGFEDVCFDVDISDDWSSWTASVSPSGTFNPEDSSVCFFAAQDGIHTYVISVTDSCGAMDADTVNVDVQFNRPPVITAVSRLVTVCSPGRVCAGGISVFDPDDNLTRFYLSGGGSQTTFDSAAGIICFDAPGEGAYCFDLIAEDECGEVTTKDVCITVDFNAPPMVTIDDIEGTPIFNDTTEVCFSIAASDPNTGQLFDLDMIEGAGTFNRIVSHSPIDAQHCFIADTTGCYQFVFEATDSCGVSARDTTLICIRIEPPDTMFQICIDQVESLNGRNVSVKVRGLQMMEMGGYDFLICYDPTMLHFSAAYADSALSEWEYFTYRVGSSTGCLPCGAGVVRLLGIADMNNGAAHPPSWAFTPKGPLHELVFFVTEDRTFINQCAPIQFCSWQCRDNTIASKSGDTLYVGIDNYPDSCIEDGGKNPILRRIDFNCNGQVCIVPPEDDRGDINLNGIANEVADAVLFSNWFIHGDEVWDPIYSENQILATDVNCDGLVLTLSDLVTLIRIVTGDEAFTNCPDAPGKIAPSANYVARLQAERVKGGLTFSIETPIDLGGIFVNLTVSGDGFGAVEWQDDLGGMTPLDRQSAKEVRTLLVRGRSGTRIPAGETKLFTIPWDGAGEWRIQQVEAAGAEAEPVQVEFVSGSAPLPTRHALHQNYPNPFNAGTRIQFDLGEAAEWEITIYNVLGQAVRRFNGADEAGTVSIEWDARTSDGDELASGVYFARLKIASFTATKKMVLLK